MSETYFQMHHRKITSKQINALREREKKKLSPCVNNC